jgi:hypothetical protein
VQLPYAGVVGCSVVDVALACAAVASKSEARRLIAGRGLFLGPPRGKGGEGDGGAAVSDPTQVLQQSDLLMATPAAATAAAPGSPESAARRGVLTVRCGKKRTTVIVVTFPMGLEP